MKLRNFGMFSFSALIVLMLAGCKSSAPELSFEDTLKVYTEQTSTIKEMLNFVNDTGSQIENRIEAETRYNVGDSMKGELSLNTDVISDNNTKDTEAKVSIGLKTDDGDVPTDGFYVKSASVDLNTMMKDFKLYFKLLDFSVDSNQPEYVSMISEVVNGFKNQWLTIDAEEFTELLKKSTDKQFDLVGYLQSKDNIEKIFEEKELTKYNGYPAWKVSFNSDEIKKIAKEIYELEQKEAERISSENESVQEEIQMFNDMIDKLEIENSEAYFVIHSSDKVDFVLKNIDIITAEEKINIKEVVNEKMFGNDSENIEITISDIETEESELKIIIDLLPSLTSYGINVKVNSKEGQETQEIFNINGEIKASVAEKTSSMNTKFMLESDSISANVKLDMVNNKIKDHVFETPKDVQSLDEVIGSLLGENEEIDDEDYIYDYDEEDIEEEDNTDEGSDEEDIK